MSTNRRIFNVHSVFVGPSPSSGNMFLTGNYGNSAQQAVSPNRVAELHRVQSFTSDVAINKLDINQFNQLAAIDRIIVEQPVINSTMSYYVNDFSNEKLLGLTISTGQLVGILSGVITKVTDDQNIFLRINREGVDVLGSTTNDVNAVVGLGNSYLTSYSMEAAVGQIPTVNVGFTSLNVKVDNSVTLQSSPAVNPTDGSPLTGWFYSLPASTQSSGGNTINANVLSISALRPGDINLSLGTSEIFADFSDLKVQNATLSFDLNRENLQKLGSRFAYSIEPTFPVTVQLTVNALLGDTVSGNLAYVINNNRDYNPIINIYRPGTTTTQCWYLLSGAKLDNFSYNESVGANGSVDLTFSAQLGGGTSQGMNLYISGIN